MNPNTRLYGKSLRRGTAEGEKEGRKGRMRMRNDEEEEGKEGKVEQAEKTNVHPSEEPQRTRTVSSR